MNALTFPRLESMASGNNSILLQVCEADGFQNLAASWSQAIGGKLGRQIIGPDQSQCDFILEGKLFWMAWDIWQGALSLEPQNDDAASVIPRIFATIKHSMHKAE
jgi:hypothetical protein